MTDRVLVTGATGLIGRYLPDALGVLGYQVHATARHVPAQAASLAATWHRCDLLDPESRMALIGRVRPSLLLHLAWITEHGTYWSSEVNRDWLTASLDLFERFAGCGGRRFVGAGTCAEYDWSYALADEATTPTCPSTLYGETKLALLQHLLAAGKTRGVEVAWGRIFLTFGPGEDRRRFIPSVIDAVLDGREAKCTSGKQVRDLLHAADIAEGFAALAASSVLGAVNIASGEGRSLASVANLIGELAGRPELIRLGALPDRPGEPPSLVALCRRLHEDVKFTPRQDFRTRLTETIEQRRNAFAAM